MLPGFQLLLGEHPLLAVNMGGGPFFNHHTGHFPSKEFSIKNEEAVARLFIIA